MQEVETSLQFPRGSNSGVSFSRDGNNRPRHRSNINSFLGPRDGNPYDPKGIGRPGNAKETCSSPYQKPVFT
ncbi:hypothetical protein ACFX19_003602 [Malus domestica]